MEKEITIPQDVRTFRIVCGKQLARTGDYLEMGSTVVLGEPCSMFYDHRNQLAVPIKSSEVPVFLIVSEIGIPSLVH